MTAQLPLRNAFAELQAPGLLHLHAARLREAGSIAARHAEIALREANVVAQDILDTLCAAGVRIPRHPTAYSSDIRPAAPRASDRSGSAV